MTDFAVNYGNIGGDRIVLVEVDPADVVSIPKDCDCQKVRTCKYKVLQEFKGALPEGGVRSTEDPYMDSFDDDDDDDDTCAACGCELNENGDCDTRGCENNPEIDMVLTKSELDEVIRKAKQAGRTELINELI